MLRLEELRRLRKMTQISLAQKVGITQGHLSDLENGNCFPSFDVLIRLARALECSLDELVDIEAYPVAS